MTYQLTTAPASIVAGLHRAGTSVGAFFRSVGHAMMVNSTANQRLNRIHALQAKSDAELAALRIRREHIVHEVFKDLYYI